MGGYPLQARLLPSYVMVAPRPSRLLGPDQEEAGLPNNTSISRSGSKFIQVLSSLPLV
ncbi:hypothetical protein DSO57_1036489 [Entomophthora muscae]|uniref:Uncharacterized protein n=3 Tax=Entomophthora muscae TaxID=34485 RepID=A0ACC2U9M6_9FUNG|nr:hypothetical protein DSO57_1036633 [Entomophthora muscae]KAJ9048283.1 hypothetical protein DSO57_1036641 [Entomophthora muscae]KAJ9083246.1 hypothetical protein DSO57_1036489 [Entomophthora muscae]